MSIFDAPKTTYSDTLAQWRVISDAIFMTNIKDTPLILALGGLDGARSKFGIHMNGKKIEILEDAIDTISTTANITNLTNDTTFTSLTVADASPFKVGHVVKIDAELCWVSSASGTTLQVTRNVGGTVATHAATSTITIVGMARLEAATTDYDAMMGLSNPYNYTSIFQSGLLFSGTEMAIDQHGGDPLERQTVKKALKNMIDLEKMVFANPTIAAASATTPRMMGGLGSFITSNTVVGGGAITKTQVDSCMEIIYGEGGTPDIIVMNHALVRDLKDLIDTSSFVNLTYSNNQLGMGPLQKLVTQYGTLGIVPDRHCPVGNAWILNSQKAGFYTLRDWAWREVPYAGDARASELIGEFSFLVANDKEHGVINTLTS
jgi:hypothetical protein